MENSITNNNTPTYIHCHTRDGTPSKTKYSKEGALFGHSARVNEEHYTIVKDDKLINSAKKAFGMVDLAVNDDGNSTNNNGSIVKNCDNSSNNGLLTPNEPHKIIQFPKSKP